jgi:hypothetical protein
LVADFAAELAAQHNARLILQHVICPRKRAGQHSDHSIDQIEADLLALVPPELEGRITVRVIAGPGDPAEVLFYQARTRRSDRAGSARRIGVAFRSHKVCCLNRIALTRRRNSSAPLGWTSNSQFDDVRYTLV